MAIDFEVIPSPVGNIAAIQHVNLAYCPLPREKVEGLHLKRRREALDDVLHRLPRAMFNLPDVGHSEPDSVSQHLTTLARLDGYNPADIAKQMGHKDLQMLLKHYSRWIAGGDNGR